MRKTFLSLAFLALIPSGCGRTTAPAESPAESRERADARAARDEAQAVARLFLNTLSVKGGDREQLAVTTKSFQDRRQATGGLEVGWDDCVFAPHPPQSLAPPTSVRDRFEFWGEIQMGLEYARSGGFTLRVVRDPAAGDWRVDYFSPRLDVMGERRRQAARSIPPAGVPATPPPAVNGPAPAAPTPAQQSAAPPMNDDYLKGPVPTGDGYLKGPVLAGDYVPQPAPPDNYVPQPPGGGSRIPYSPTAESNAFWHRMQARNRARQMLRDADELLIRTNEN